MTPDRAKRSHPRFFVALDLPLELRRLTSGWGREVARGSNSMRPVPARNIHVTLAFVGERPAAEISPLSQALRMLGASAAGRPPLALSLGAPVWLPRRRPRALALEIHDDGGRLRELQAELAGLLGEATGWRPERAFRPHLTAVRLGRGAPAAGPALPVSPAAEFVPASVSLVLSRLTPEGAEYEPLETVNPPGKSPP